MALGNGAPDIATAIAGIGQGRPGLVFGELFGTGVFLTALVAGAVCIIKPFKLMERPFLRDIVFYLIAGFWAFYIFWRQEIRLFDAVGFLALYLVYLAVVLIGRYVNNKIRTDVPYKHQVCY
jgi:sodium/potassium/calcium exchanger 6